MIRYILSGFELELFSLHEYPYMYWYLYELLYPWLTTCLHRAESCLSGPATNSFFSFRKKILIDLPRLQINASS